MIGQEKSYKSIFLSIDWITILLYVILIIWGWFSVCGACYDYNNPDLFSWETNSGKQIVWGGTSLVLAAVLMLIEKRFYDTAAYVIYVAMMLLLLVTIFIAPDTKGSRSWLPIGSSVKIQPAEFAKFAVALALGKLMDKYGFSIRKTKDIGIAIALILIPMLLIIAQRKPLSPRLLRLFPHALSRRHDRFFVVQWICLCALFCGWHEV